MASLVVIGSGDEHALARLLGSVVLRHDGTHEGTLARVVEHDPVVAVVDVAALGTAGFELLARLGEREETRHVAVVAIVPHDRGAIERAFRLGADDFMRADEVADVSARARVERFVRHAAVAARLDTKDPRDRSPSERPPESERSAATIRLAAERRIKRFQPYADFFKNSADGMVVIESSGNILFANPQARALFPVRSAAERANVLDFLEPTDHARARDIARGFLEGRFPKGVDFRVAAKGRPLIICVNFSATLRSESAVLFTFRDVTRERQTEDELTKAREFLERVIDSSLDAIVASDLHGNVRLFNRAASQIFGYAPDQVVGVLSVEKLYPPGVAREVMKKVRGQSHGGYGRLEGYSVNMQHASGHDIPVRISAGLIYENGKPWGSVGVFRDVRDELRMAARLRQAEDAVRHHEKGVAVAQLAGATAHELNQPLTVVIAYADLLRIKLGPDNPLLDAVDVIGEQAERMAEIVRQVGRITRYETKSYVGSAQILDLEKASRPDSKR